jgi:hypothetical protein
LSRSTSPGFICTLIMNGYGSLLERHHQIENVTWFNRRNPCWRLFRDLLGFMSPSCCQRRTV